MPATVHTEGCTGWTSGSEGCFYARKIYKEWDCKECGVKDVEVLGIGTYHQSCIVCFYKNEGIRKCIKDGCVRMREVVRAKQVALSDATSSLESHAGPSNARSSNNVRQQLEAVTEDLDRVKTRLNETHKVLEDEIHAVQYQVVEHDTKIDFLAQAFDKWSASWGYGKWCTSATDPSTGTSSSSHAGSAGPRLAGFCRS